MCFGSRFLYIYFLLNTCILLRLLYLETTDGLEMHDTRSISTVILPNRQYLYNLLFEY